MLELQKFVLQRVCEDSRLFKRELKKSLRWLSTPEVKLFKQWVWREFGHTHAEILNDVLCEVEV